MKNRDCLYSLLILSMSILSNDTRPDAFAGVSKAEDEAPASRMPEAPIESLRAEFAALEDVDSTTEIRRTCKNIDRRAGTLLEAHPEAPNRFLVLGLVFEVRQMLFSMRQTDETREALLETAHLLLDAPDAYAGIRLGADVLLQEIELAREDSSPQDRARAIAELADRYRGTPAEAESLILASMIAFDIGHRALLETFRQALSTRFRQDPTVSAFLRDRFAVSAPVRFGGTFQQADGTPISFPTGQLYVLCFWSRDAPRLDSRIEEVKSLQTHYPGQFKVFSFNLDERPDGGKALLETMKLDWTPILLPGGADNPAYRSVGGAQLFTALVIDPYGWARTDALGSKPVSLQNTYEAALESPRRLALLRSLSIGDFLVMDLPDLAEDTMLRGALADIQACFTVPPVRYRLTPDEAFKNYEDAERLCGEAVTKYPGARDLWIVHNRRVIALLGMWRCTADRAYLDRAAASAKASLAMDSPPGAGTVPHFCLATAALEDEDANPEQVLSEFIEAAGGANAPGAAHAAALMLSLDAHSPDLFITYADKLLNEDRDDTSSSWVASFLLDRSSIERFYGKSLPGSVATTTRMSGKPFTVDWETLGGGRIHLPEEDAANKITALVFMEPSADGKALALQKSLMDHLVRTATDRSRHGIDLTGVFFCGDTNRVSAMMKQNKWSFKALSLPEDAWHPLVMQTGIFAPDLRPNVYLLRPDGSVLLALSGVSTDSENVDKLVGRIDEALRDYTMQQADLALANEDYVEYAALLEVSFPLKNRQRSRHEPPWRALNAHRRKLIWATMQLERWHDALDTANASVHAHEQQCGSCRLKAGPLFVRAETLRELGRIQDAETALDLARACRCPPESEDVAGMNYHRIVMGTKDLDGRLALVVSYIRSGIMDESGSDLRNLAGDLLMRAEILEKTGSIQAAGRDRLRASALTWPDPPVMADPRLATEACDYRRRQASAHSAKDPGRALALVNVNLHGHDNAAAGKGCWMCAGQSVLLDLYARALKDSEREEEAAAVAGLAEVALLSSFSSREDLEPPFVYQHFVRYSSPKLRMAYAVDRMQPGGGGTSLWQHRAALARDLMLRADIFEEMKQPQTAAKDRQRAAALTFPTNPKAAATGDALPVRYVDLVDVDGDGE